MPNTKTWIDPDGQIINTGTGVGGVYLIDPVTQKAISPAEGGGGTPTDVNVKQVGGAAIAEGQATMANSIPMVIASDQTKYPIEVQDSNNNILDVPIAGATFADTLRGLLLLGKSGTTGVNAIARLLLMESDGTAHTLDNNSAGMKSDLDTLLGLLLAQSSTTSGQTGPLIQGAVTSASPTYVNNQTSPLSLTTSGGLRAAQSGNWTVLPGNTPNTTAWLVKQQPVSTFFISAGTAGNTVVKGTPGIFYGVFASSVGAGAGLIYDNATTNSGTPVGSAPTAIGFDQGVPAAGVNCVNGITVAGSATNPALTVFFI